MTPERILEAVRSAWPEVDLAAEPRPLAGGYWATIVHLRLTGAPDRVPGDVVLRVAPHPELGAKEIAVQAALAEAGAPTPAVHLTGPPGGPLGDAWAVMDLAPGEPLLGELDGLDGAAAVGKLPRLLARLPAQLADTMAAVHRIEPGPVVERVRAAAPTVAFSVDELWSHLLAGAELADRQDLVGALHALAERRPVAGEAVLCHGDLHPFNLLRDGDRITVLDWTAALAGPPAYDVAFTRLLLRYPPVTARPALRPVVGAGARGLARRFVRRYHRANPAADLRDLGWYTALHASRILIDLATWQSTDDPRAGSHPWSLIAPAVARELARTTGRDVRSRWSP